MTASASLKSIETRKRVYDGPIFDADTHIQEKDFSFFRKYLPEKYHKDWLIERRYGPDGSFGIYIGDYKNEVTEANPSGKIAPPGRLKEWLAAINAGATIEEGYDPTPDMWSRNPRLAKLDEFGVDGSIMFVGEFVTCLGPLGVLAQEKGPEGALAVFHAWNQYLVDEWGLNVEDRIYPTAVLALFDLDWAVQEAKWLVENGVRIVVMPMGPAHGKAAGDPYFDPLWRVLDAAGVVVAYHVSEANFMHSLAREFGEKPLQSRRVGQSAWQWMFSYSEIP